MLPKKFTLDLVTPDRRVLALEAEAAVLPGAEGSFGVRPGHHPLLAALQPGWMKVWHGSVREDFAISGGFAEVLPDRVNVLVSACERITEIDPQRAAAARERAIKRLKSRDPGVDRERAARALERARARLRAARRRAPE